MPDATRLQVELILGPEVDLREFTRDLSEFLQDWGIEGAAGMPAECQRYAESCAEDTEDMSDELADSEPEKTRTLSF